jgi:2-polyprenyl-3-methyl-5-hydroxy-6-metoxy-1,4-benzoquinol methylase
MTISIFVPSEEEEYWQKYAFGGPDQRFNQRLLHELRAGMPSSNHLEGASDLSSFTDSYVCLEEATQQCHLFSNENRDLVHAFQLEPSFIWKFEALRRKLPKHSCKKLLVLGVGGGLEIIVLRALWPNAQIDALDWVSKCDRSILSSTDTRLIVGNVFEELNRLQHKYDVIFSHHFIEHLYKPLDFLSQVNSLLLPNGHLVSGLPLLLESPAYSDTVRDMISARKQIRLLDLSLLDIGHPFKTSRAGLAILLSKAGFTDISYLSCPQMAARSMKVSSALLDFQQAEQLKIYKHLVQPIKHILSVFIEAMMANNVPGWKLLLKAALSFEKRVFRSASGPKIANYAHDVLLIATTTTYCPTLEKP